MVVKVSATRHKGSCGHLPIPVVTIHRVTKLTVSLFQRCDPGILMWSGRLEREVSKNIKRQEDSYEKSRPERKELRS